MVGKSHERKRPSKQASKDPACWQIMDSKRESPPQKRQMGKTTERDQTGFAVESEKE